MSFKTNPQTDIVVETNNLSKSFNNKKILNNITFSLHDKEHLAILGPGGCGKSTFLKILLGLIPPDSGDVNILGQNIFQMSKPKRQNLLKSLGMAFQQGALFDFLTVRENILFAMKNMTTFDEDFMENRILEMLEAVNLSKAINKIPSELSGGMRRRVGIVRALATNPKIAFLDEPTAGLDPVTSTTVIDMIHALASQIGTSLLCVTSSVEVAFTFSKNVAILRDGNLCATGTKNELLSLNDSWLTHFLEVRESPTLKTIEHHAV